MHQKGLPRLDSSDWYVFLSSITLHLSSWFIFFRSIESIWHFIMYLVAHYCPSTFPSTVPCHFSVNPRSAGACHVLGTALSQCYLTHCRGSERTCWTKQCMCIYLLPQKGSALCPWHWRWVSIEPFPHNGKPFLTQLQAKFGHLSDGSEYSFLLIPKYLALPRRHRTEHRDANVINGYPGTMKSCVRHEADSWLEWSLAGTGFFETGGLESAEVDSTDRMGILIILGFVRIFEASRNWTWSFNKYFLHVHCLSN